MQKLISFFESIGFNGTDLEKSVSAFEYKVFQRNDFVVEAGKTSKHIALVESGLFQYYVIKDGEERTTYVSVPNTFLASLLSFVSGTPSLENVRALTQGSLFMISKINLKRLVNEIPAFKDFYIDLLERSIVGIDASRHDLIVLTAEQRYARMLQEEPHFLQQIPLLHLASMLGITPRHLSRIRKNHQ
ncbi:MAG: Crp/Fnr family transcriptional regulator [Bacteroidota bacterium]|nr:Crp/Fnr family transcriptional regulator [Bacteroidota bacterium]